MKRVFQIFLIVLLLITPAPLLAQTLPELTQIENLAVQISNFLLRLSIIVIPVLIIVGLFIRFAAGFDQQFKARSNDVLKNILIGAIGLAVLSYIVPTIISLVPGDAAEFIESGSAPGP